MMEHKTEERRYRLPPCPAWDVEGMECWLNDLAGEGLFLEQDGIFAGVASFTTGEPRFAKYRLEAAGKSTSMWAPDGGEPDVSQVELSQAYSWEYVAKRGGFYIYRTFAPDARELHTDPEVHAMSMNAARMGRFSLGKVFELLFWFFIYLPLLLKGAFFLTILSLGTGTALLTAAFFLWIIADTVAGGISLHRLTKRLRRGEQPDTEKNWRRGQVFHHGRRAVKALLGAALVCIFLGRWSEEMLHENRIPLENYPDPLPFATMADFAGEGVAEYRITMRGIGKGFHSIEEWSDLLAPQCIDYAEHAELTSTGGRVIGGGLYVDYYEAANPTLARILAKEFYRIDRFQKNFEPMDLSIDGMDYAAVYRNNLHFPTVILQKGNRVLHAYFYQTGENPLPVEEWTGMLAESLSPQGISH